MAKRNSYTLADHKTLRFIKLPPNSTASEEFAAEDLRRHLRQITGQPAADRRVESGGVIYLNDWAAAATAGINKDKLKLSGDAFHLQVCGEDLFVLSVTDRGILYGASELLRRLGCRWYTPSVKKIPSLREATIAVVDETVRPAFEYRDMIAQDCQEPEFLMRLRVNGHFCRIPEYLGGHQVYGLHVHTYHALVPPSEHFDKHPEYFSLVGGKRVIAGGQLCLSNPEVKRIAVENILKRIVANPQSKIFSVSQNDWHGACECPECRKIVDEESSQSGPVLRFANAVAEEVVKTHPHILISTLAYTYTLDAPKKVMPHPNVRVRLCPISCCSGHPFGTCDNPESRRFLTAFTKWAKRMSQMYIWHYSINFRNSLLPVPNFDELAGNLKFYHNKGVFGVFVQDMSATGYGSESSDLRAYLQAELLWNPAQDVWPLVKEWLDAVHGKAAPAMLRYYKFWHDFVRNHRDIHPVCYASPDHPLYSKANIKKADTFLQEAEELAIGRSKLRIQVLRGGLQLPHLWNCGGSYKIEGSQYKGKATAEDQRLFNTVLKRWEDFGITHPAEDESVEAIRQKWGARIFPHPVKHLRAGKQEVVVAPTLGGRLIEWYAHGHQWLAMPDPANAFQPYPFSGGYSNLAVLSAHCFQGWKESYAVTGAHGKSKLTLHADNLHWVGDIRLSHTYTLEEDALLIASVVENIDDRPIALRWGCSLQLCQKGWEDLRVHAGADSLSLDASAVKDGLGHAHTLEFAPTDGRWELLLPGYRVSNEFAGGIEQVIVGLVRDRKILAMDLRTPRVTLVPGQHIRVAQRIRIESIGKR